MKTEDVTRSEKRGAAMVPPIGVSVLLVLPIVPMLSRWGPSSVLFGFTSFFPAYLCVGAGAALLLAAWTVGGHSPVRSWVLSLLALVMAGFGEFMLYAALVGV